MGNRANWRPIWLAGAALVLSLPAGAQNLAQPTSKRLLAYRNDTVPTPSSAVNPARSANRPLPRFGHFAPLVRQEASKRHLDPRLIQAVIHVESGGNPSALSPKGAAGLMQLVPATAQRFGVTDVFNPAENIRGGTALLTELVRRYNGDLGRVLAAYYAGEAAVARADHLSPARETASYVRAVLDAYYQAPPTAQPRARSANPIYVTLDDQGCPVFTNQ